MFCKILCSDVKPVPEDVSWTRHIEISVKRVVWRNVCRWGWIKMVSNLIEHYRVGFWRETRLILIISHPFSILTISLKILSLAGTRWKVCDEAWIIQCITSIDNFIKISLIKLTAVIKKSEILKYINMK